MSETLMLEIEEQVFESIRMQAEAVGTSPAQFAAAALAQRFNGSHKKPDLRTDAEKQAARERFRSQFGSVNLGSPIGVDKQAIDADLAREYGDPHETTNVQDVIAQIKALRRGNRLGEGLSGRDLIDEGRRY
jgi:hypothetical protein